MPRPQFYLIYTVALCLAFAKASFAQSFQQKNEIDLNYYLPQTISYNPKIPTPKEILGFTPGKWHVTHDKLISYMYALAAASDRIQIENRGYTYEDRPLILLTITSPDNHNKLPQIKKEHLQLTQENTTLNTSNMPIVVYQGFSIHGNESSGSNAALILAYHLAAATGPDIDKLLNNSIILLDPAMNPDGLQRFASWVNQHKNKNITADNNDREYNEVWPGGRTNHYWFDMNRDWLPVQLPESQARITTFHEWQPNILTDHHEMGTNATFFFQPGIPSRTHPLTPIINQELTYEIGTYHAAALDKIGSLYYTQESYDDFYYGKGSTFPDINGAVGILFEQASSRGHAQESENGILTFPFTIRNQFTAGLSTLKAAASMRKKLLDYQQDFYHKAIKNASSDAIIFGDHKDAGRTQALAQILQRHHIKIHDLKKDLVKNGTTYKKGYAYIIPKKQKNARLIEAMFEKRTQFKDSLFYDISAWTLPLAFDLDYDENISLSHVGKIVEQIEPLKGSFYASQYAYLISWNEQIMPKVLHQLLDQNIRVKVAMQEFSIDNNSYDYGTLLIPVQNQPIDSQRLQQLLQSLSSKHHINITGVNTGLTTGIDLGSRQFKIINKPNIAVLVGPGINSYDAGEIWHLLDQRYDIPVTKLDINSITNKDLSKYSCIIIPSKYSSPDKSTIDQLKTWTKNGGTLIAYKHSLKWLSKHKLLPLEFKTTDLTATNINFKSKSAFYGAQNIGGAIFNTSLDRSHPIAFGYKDNQLPMFRNTSIFIQPDKNSFNNPIEYTTNPLMSGYISEEKLSLLKGSVPFKHHNYGRGDVIGFTDNTQFRAFWYGTNKLLMNAIFFSKHM